MRIFGHPPLVIGKRSADDARDVLQRARELIADDAIDQAVALLRLFAETAAPHLANALTLLDRELRDLQRSQRIGTITREDAQVERTRLGLRLLELVGDAVAPPLKRAAPRELSASELKVRARYLRILRNDVENRLKVSIHIARFIDLGISESPAATYLPWVYRDTESIREFSGFGEAFDACSRRMLLLGAPGSGKSTTLLHVALELISQAEQDASAPIPVLVNLSKFRIAAQPKILPSAWLRAGDERRRAIERWLAAELAGKCPGLSQEVARGWVEREQIAALLDGLDEVSNEYRAELVRLLNDTFLRDHPDLEVLVCSRIDEYAPLQEQKETRLQLGGAITLQPLGSTQIAEYLEAAHATGLRDALPADRSLYEMAQTPLTLSMMTLAYGGLAPTAIPSHLSLAERRHHLMEAYAKRMLQRKERRDRGIPFDENRDNDVPVREYAFSPEQINRHLGWLAVRLSVRMQTSVSFDRFYSFLKAEHESEQLSVQWAIRVVHASILPIVALLLAMTIMPAGLEAWIQLGAVAGLACAAYVGFDSLSYRKDSKGIVVTRTLAVLAVAIAVLSRAVCLLLSIDAPTAVAVILVCAAVGPTFLLYYLDEREPWALSVPLTCGISVAAASVIAQHPDLAPHRYLLIACALVTGLALLACILTALDSGSSLVDAATVVGVLAVSVGALAAGVWLVGDLDWYDAAFVLTVLCMHFIAEVPGTIAVVVVSAILGGLLGGVPGEPTGVAVVLVAFLTIGLLTNIRGPNAAMARMFDRLAVNPNARLGEIVARVLLEPAMRWVLVFTGCMPFRRTQFVRYCEGALLLERSGADFEFMHRLLRDHFALRELQPQLSGADPDRRLAAIRNLGFQGESGIDLLAELVEAENAELREAAATAMGRIASPHVIAHLARLIEDRDPRVRCAAAVATKTKPYSAVGALLTRAAKDEDRYVQFAVVEALDPQLPGRPKRLPDELSRLLGRMLETNADHRLLEEIITRFADNDLATRLPAWTKSTLGEWIHHPRPSLRQSVLWLVTIRPDLVELDKIIDALGSDVDAVVRRRAAFALGHLNHPSSNAKLIRALSDRDPAVRAAAAESLARRGALEAIEPLLGCLDDWRVQVRKAAAEALGELEHLRGLDPLIRALDDRWSDVRSAAARSLEKLGDARAIEPLIKVFERRWRRVGLPAAEALVSLGAVDAILNALSAGRAPSRADAARALARARIAGRSLFLPLSRALSDKSHHVRAAAAAALHHLGDRQAIEPLIGALSDRNDEVILAAAKALAELPDLRAVPPMRAAMAQVHEVVRPQIRAALMRLERELALEGPVRGRQRS